MLLEGISVGVVVTGSHCTIADVVPVIGQLKGYGAKIRVILSYSVAYTDNRFHSAKKIREIFSDLSDMPLIDTITGAEPIGPRKLLDIVLIAPCTGNTLAKIANGITDTPALMAVKAQLRNQRPVVIAVSTNDGLGLNLKNLAVLMNTKNFYFVPFGQDNPIEKPTSLVAKMELIPQTIVEALQGRQIQPVLLGPPESVA